MQACVERSLAGGFQKGRKGGVNDAVAQAPKTFVEETPWKKSRRKTIERPCLLQHWIRNFGKVIVKK